MVDGQEYTYDYDNARPALARIYDIGQGSETFEYTQNFVTSQTNIKNLNVEHRKPQNTELTVCSLNVQVKKSKGPQFLIFCRKYDIFGLYETCQHQKEAFDSFLDSYTKGYVH